MDSFRRGLGIVDLRAVIIEERVPGAGVRVEFVALACSRQLPIQFRVALAQRPEVVSPVVLVSVPLSVKTDIRTVKTFRHSKKVRFKGVVVLPARAFRTRLIGIGHRTVGRKKHQQPAVEESCGLA